MSIQHTSAIQVFHFTHIDNLSSIVQFGLSSDVTIMANGRLSMESGSREIKHRRRNAKVNVEPFGTVGEYVPFYFAPRSPMLYVITLGNVPSFTGEPRDLVYLHSTLGMLQSREKQIVLTDRNAATAVAEFSNDPQRWQDDGFIDWELMKSRMWNDIPEYPDRKERRMAECLVYEAVEWDAIIGLSVADVQRRNRVESILYSLNITSTIDVQPAWYF